MKKQERNIVKNSLRLEEKLFEKVMEHYKFDKAKLKLINLFFLEGKSVVSSCLLVGISRATFFNWINEILDIAYKWAVELGIVEGD